ncbi:MAG: amino acid adenylation domain-containing protein [Neomegalonema sp.]|nr:amino acid adenylation domain-containing protein [Neomegalonema sp.]
MAPIIDPDQLVTRVERLIEARALEHQGKTALICGQDRLTYGELLERSARLAAALRMAGAAQGHVIGLYLERSEDMVAAMLAVLRIGAAYLPLDPDFPPQRLEHMIADSGTRLVITQPELSAQAPAGDYEQLDIDASASLAPDAGTPAEPEENGADLAYLLYTSGSTGKPKGVAITTRNLMNFLLSMAQEPGLDADTPLLAVTTLSFDISMLELLLPLIVGSSVVIARAEDAADGERLAALIAEHGVGAMQATPTTWRLLLEAGWAGDAGFKALCGGEPLPADLARDLAPKVGALWNMYGPTETTIWSTCYRVPESGAPVLIGKPIANTSVYVLDKAMRPVPIGVPGEIFIGGAGVAQGYVALPEQNAERFVPDPFTEDFGGRMYRTGDFGRQLADGNLEFRERTDRQVKIRGFRIELPEIEAQLGQHPAIAQGVVKVWEPRANDARLVAYLQPEPGSAELDVAALRDWLRERLPGYMIPQHLVIQHSFPLTPNGKINRRALPEPEDAPTLEIPYVAPEGETETTLAAVFAEILRLEQVSATANFFDLGGHSILATRALAQLRRSGWPSLTLRAIFQEPDLRSLARHLDSLRSASEDREELEF